MGKSAEVGLSQPGAPGPAASSGLAVSSSGAAGSPALAGRWELPGGKVEPGESPQDALVREVFEELGCVIEVCGWLGGEAVVRPGTVLRAARARLVSGEPTPREHDAVRWLAADELAGVRWLPADVLFLAELRELLASGLLDSAP